jgi:hypothetical protein
VQAQSSDRSLDGVDLGAPTQRAHRTLELKRVQSGESMTQVLPGPEQISRSSKRLHLAPDRIDWPAVHVPTWVCELRRAIAKDHEYIWKLGHD